MNDKTTTSSSSEKLCACGRCGKPVGPGRSFVSGHNDSGDGISKAWQAAHDYNRRHGLFEVAEIAAEAGVGTQCIRKRAKKLGFDRRRGPSPGGMRAFTADERAALLSYPSRSEANRRRVERSRQNLAALKADQGVYDVADLMGLLDRTKSAVVTLIKSAGVGRLVPGPGGPEHLVWVVTQEEFEILKQRVQGHWVQGNRKHRVRWYERRFRKKKMHGREFGREKLVQGELAETVRAMKAKYPHWGVRTIAREASERCGRRVSPTTVYRFLTAE